MGLFSYTQRVENGIIYIPNYIRAYLGWYNDLELHISSLETSASKENLANELIVTTVPPQDRLDLWRLQASFKDRKGLIKELTGLLKKEMIDVISCKVSTVDQNRYLNVEFEVDNQLYKAEFDRDTIARQKNKYVYLDELKNHIVSEFIKDILFVKSDKVRPLAKIKRNLPLYRSKDNLNKYEMTTIHKKGVKMPLNMMEEIFVSFLEKYPNINSLKGKNKLPLASVVADLESFLVRVFIFYKDTGYIHFRIIAKNKVGALAGMAEILFENNLNINQMFNRPIGDSKKALTDYLVHYSNGETLITDRQLRALIKRIFLKNDIAKEFEFQVTFPRLKIN